MLKPLAENLWHAEFVRLGHGMQTPCRMVVARLPNGDLWLHSPIPIDDALASTLKTLGPVRHIVAPNAFHHLYLAACGQRYPRACLYAAPGLPRRLPSLPFAATLTDQAPQAWHGAFEQCVVQGFPWPWSEVVFFHRATATVIVTDLVLNVHKPKGWVTSLMFGIARGYRGVTLSRFWRRVMMPADRREATRNAAARVLAWDAHRLVMSHGEMTQQHVRTWLRKELHWAF
ncbi:MAG: DUF4336 domain-containing protein [Myxococcota bacterium]